MKVPEDHFKLVIDMKENDPEDTMGQRLKKARKQKGLTIKEVAEQAEISPHTLGYWENDKHPVHRPESLFKVAAVLGVPMEYLLPPLDPEATFSQKLIHYRWLHGWNQEEMAKQLGISSDTLRIAEHGQYNRLVQEKAYQLYPRFFGE